MQENILIYYPDLLHKQMWPVLEKMVLSNQIDSSPERAVSLRWPAFESRTFLSHVQMLPDQKYDIPYHNGILMQIVILSLDVVSLYIYWS